MYLFHGTTSKNGEQILQDGYLSIEAAGLLDEHSTYHPSLGVCFTSDLAYAMSFAKNNSIISKEKQDSTLYIFRIDTDCFGSSEITDDEDEKFMNPEMYDFSYRCIRNVCLDNDMVTYATFCLEDFEKGGTLEKFRTLLEQFPNRDNTEQLENLLNFIDPFE